MVQMTICLYMCIPISVLYCLIKNYPLVCCFLTWILQKLMANLQISNLRLYFRAGVSANFQIFNLYLHSRNQTASQAQRL